MIHFQVIDNAGITKPIEIPEGINLSLMEVLKASDYPILATCDGMALCATCKVELVTGIEKLELPSDAELDMLDSLPNATPSSRLSCQIRMGENLNGAVFQL